MKPIRVHLFGIIAAIISAIHFVVCYVVDNFKPLFERGKTHYGAIAAKVSHVAYNANAWRYAFFARWHVDSCSFA